MGADDQKPGDLLDLTTLETLALLGERRGKDLLGQLFGLFQDQGPKSFASLRSAVAAGSSAEVKSVAHSLKGSYRSLGTPRLAEISLRLEEKGTNGDLDGAGELVDDLEQCFLDTTRALQGFLESKTSTPDGTG